MSPRVGPSSPEQESAAPSDPNAFAAMFENHAAHVFDYCTDLLGDEEAAATATETAMIAARGVLQDPERLRAWLFALARECMSQIPEASPREVPSAPSPAAARHQPGDVWQRTEHDDLAEARTERLSLADIASHGERVAAAAAEAGAGREREIFDLVYRHGIRPDHLPVVLGVSPDRARALLAAAVAAYGGSAATVIEAGAEPGSADAETAGPDGLAAKPLVPLPPSVRHRTFQAVFGEQPTQYRQARPQLRPEAQPEPEPAPAGADDGGGPATFDRARRRLLIAGIAALPAAAAVAAILYFAGSSDPHPTADPQRAVTTSSPSVSLPTSAVLDPVTSPKGHKSTPLFKTPTRAVLPVVNQDPPGTGGGQPAPGPTHTSRPHPKPTKVSTLTPSPSPSSHTSSPSPSPSPSSASSSPSPSPSGSSTSPASTTSPASSPSPSSSSAASGLGSLTALLPVPESSAPALSTWVVSR